MKRLTVGPVTEKLREIFATLSKKPAKIYADNAFDTSQMHEFCAKENIKITFRASHLSRSVIVERFHRSLHPKIAAFDQNPKNFDLALGKAVRALNLQVHDSTGFSPFFLTFGQKINPTGEQIESVSTQEWQDCVTIAKIRSDNEKAKYTDVRYSFPRFDVGSRVLVQYDGGKNAKRLEATVLADGGGAEVELSLDNRSRPLKVHKGMLYLKKESQEYIAIFKPACAVTPQKSSTDRPGNAKKEPPAPRYNLRSQNR